MPGVAASLLLAAAVLAPLVQGGAVLAPLVQGGAVQPPWRLVILPKQTLPVTLYKAESIDGRDALRIQSLGSYGNLVHDLPSITAPSRLRWAWRLQQPNPLMNLRIKAGDDTPVKLCMGFDLPLDRVPFVDRQRLSLARALTSETLPAATLCWVWGHAEPAGAVLPNPYTHRVRYLVLRTAQDAPGVWFEENRDIAADFRLAFGDESAAPPPVIALIVSGDADNTGGGSVAHVAALIA